MKSFRTRNFVLEVSRKHVPAFGRELFLYLDLNTNLHIAQKEEELGNNAVLFMS